MTDDGGLDANEVIVVATRVHHRKIGPTRWLVVIVATMLLGGAAYALATGRDTGTSVSGAREGGGPEGASTSELAAETDAPPRTTRVRPPLATLPPRVRESTTTTELDTAGGPPISGCDDHRLPSLVGVRPQDVSYRLGFCGQTVPYSDFLILTTSEPCAPNPSQAGLIASQSPGAGSTFSGALVRIEVAVYQDCASTVPPTDFVPSYPTSPPTETTPAPPGP